MLIIFLVLGIMKIEKIYLADQVANLSNSSDTLTCNKWLNAMTINSLYWNDTINTLKANKAWTIINLWSWNDVLNQNVDKGALSDIIIDGWNGYDKLIINKKKERVVIDWNYAKSCKMYIKDKWLNPWWKFKNVILKSIEEINTTNGNIKFNWTSNNSQENKNNNLEDNVSYQKIDLSSYKYLIPAYFWSEDLNKKLLKLPTKSYYYYSKSFKWWFFKIWNYFSRYDK